MNDNLDTNDTARRSAPLGSRLVMLLRGDGGTAVTNFDHAQMPLYQAALAEYGREGLVLCSVGVPMCGETALQRNLGSLHKLSPGADLSEFWYIFNRLRSENTEMSTATP